MEHRKRAYAATITQVSLIGFSFLFVKTALNSADAIDILAHRFLAAFIAMAVIVLVRKEKLGITLGKIVRVFPLAIFYPILAFLCQTIGLMYMPSTEAGIIQALIPVFAAIIAFLVLRERLRPTQVACVALSVGGIIFITVMQGASAAAFDIRGTLLMLISSVSIASYNVLTRKYVRQNSPLFLAFAVTFLGMILFNGISIGMRVAGGTLTSYFEALIQPHYAAAILYLGVAASAGTTMLASYALKYIEAAKVSVFVNLGAVITIFVGVIFLGEAVYWYHIVGAAIIIGGVLGTNFGTAGKTGKEKGLPRCS